MFLNEFLNFFSVNEALDDILADSDDEEEEQAIVNQVLDEIGIEITNKVIIFGTLYKLLRIFEIVYKYVVTDCYLIRGNLRKKGEQIFTEFGGSNQH